MKRCAALLTMLFLMLCTCAHALNAADYPAWDGSSTPENSLYGSISGNHLILEFDAGSEYSNIADGILQACFFAFDSGEQNYLELFIMLPENAAPGDVFSTTSGAMSSLSLYEVSKTGETLYFAGQVAGFAYPQGSSYELRIDSVERSNNTLSMRGSIDAQLCRFDGNTPTQDILAMSGVKFSFTMPLVASPATPGASAAPQATPVPEPSAAPFQTRPPQAAPSAAPAPKATMDPHPAFTLPPDYAIV